MTPSMIMDQLQKYLQDITQEMALGPDRLRPNVYKVDLPARATPGYDPETQETDIPPPVESTLPEERDERWPFIIVVFTGPAEDNEDGYRTVPMDFIFGCEGTGPDGYMDVLHLMEYVRASLLRETYEGWSFRLSRPLSMGFDEEQADPFWTGYMSTTWEVPSIEEEVWKHGF
ncbi:hypothetical protein FHS19_006846 [Paenibacillus rhizosphaerae]|uniref:Uncharacterized protein n=1 Tax=Paenibacillus rhizosphaerae TaxID=297318 RepID=A0A839U3T6_9BACL|nr:hypothetical protein [Paenibacillus rhizosphaerae]MBB3132119.1 hypothetical protein [Paenibacillus rhizosphaerae]